MQAQHQHLRFRVAEARVVFDQLGTVLRNHQASEQHALVRTSHGLQGADRRQHDFVERALFHRRRHDRDRGVGAHAAGVRTLVAVKHALVVLRRDERQRVFAVRENEEAGFLAFEEFLDHDFRAGITQAAAEHHVDGSNGLI